DAAGQERYRSLIPFTLQDVVGCLVVFDLTNEASFLHVRNWIDKIQNNVYSETAMILVGNKCDLEKERVISKACAEDLAKEYNINYIETSALKNINVVESVKLLLDIIMERFEQNKNKSKPNQSIIPWLNDNKNYPNLIGCPIGESKISTC
ncbi:unnamed protein product, partial [Rotaria sp. Silwood2]